MLAGAAYWVAGRKTLAPNKQTADNKAPAAVNLTRVDQLGVEMDVGDGYAVTSNKDQKALSFGPIQDYLDPTRADQKNTTQERTYQLTLAGKQGPYDVAARLTSQKDNAVTYGPEIKKINGLVLVKWAGGGDCDYRALEVIGTDHNYLFSADGCHNDQKTDFDYLENVVKDVVLFNPR